MRLPLDPRRILSAVRIRRAVPTVDRNAQGAGQVLAVGDMGRPSELLAYRQAGRGFGSMDEIGQEFPGHESSRRDVMFLRDSADSSWFRVVFLQVEREASRSVSERAEDFSTAPGLGFLKSDDREPRYELLGRFDSCEQLYGLLGRLEAKQADHMRLRVRATCAGAVPTPTEYFSCEAFGHPLFLCGGGRGGFSDLCASPHPSAEESDCAWGYGGGGPTEMAERVLYRVLGFLPRPHFIGRFCNEVVARMSQSQPFNLPVDAVCRWVEQDYPIESQEVDRRGWHVRLVERAHDALVRAQEDGERVGVPAVWTRSVQELMQEVEGSQTEFKELSDLERQADKFAKAVAAFANASGGKLILGIADKDHRVVGIDHAFAVGGSRSAQDLFQEKLLGAMRKRLRGGHLEAEVRFERLASDDVERSARTICVVAVFASISPVWVVEEIGGSPRDVFFVRRPGESERLTGPALSTYLLERFSPGRRERQTRSHS
jgi:Putative DNA-binding domain